MLWQGVKSECSYNIIVSPPFYRKTVGLGIGLIVVHVGLGAGLIVVHVGLGAGLIVVGQGVGLIIVGLGVGLIIVGLGRSFLQRSVIHIVYVHVQHVCLHACSVFLCVYAVQEQC